MLNVWQTSLPWVLPPKFPHSADKSASVPAALGHNWATVSEVFLFCFTLLALLKEVLALMVARKKVLKMETKRSPRQECWSPSARMWQECSREDCGQIPICQQIPFVTQCFSWEPFCVCLQYPVTKGCPPCNWVVPIQAHHTQAHNLKQHWGHKLDFSCILKRSSESHLKHSGCKLVFR